MWFALKFKRYDRESYEWGLTRTVIANAFGNSGKRLEDMMLQNILREAPKPWEYMTEDEQRAAIAKSKAARGMKG